jgi:hypothetical protein
MNYIWKEKWKVFFIRNSWQVFIVSDIFMLSKNHPGEKKRMPYTHGQQVINVFYTTVKGLCMSAFLLAIWKSKN